MRILVITQLYPDDALVATTNAVHNLVRFWTDYNQVICFKEEWLCVSLKREKSSFSSKTLFQQIRSLVGYKYTEKDKVKIFRFTCIANLFPKYNIDIFRKIFSKAMSFKMDRQLKKMGFVPDVVITHMPAETIIDYIGNLQLKCPKIAVMHRGDLDYLDVNLKNKYIVKSKIELFNKEFDAVFARSKIIYDKLKKIEKLQNVQKEIISSGVEKNIYYSPKMFEWNIKKISFLYVGDLIPQKGVDVIINSLSQLEIRENCEFQIIGEGKESNHLEALIKDLKLNECVEMLGKIPHEKIYGYMMKADIFIMPSQHETLGLVYLEAMANGCITIGSKNEGIDGIIINEENGFLVNALDVDDLSKCLRNIIALPIDKLKTISQNAKETADQYTFEKRAELYMKSIRKFVSV